MKEPIEILRDQDSLEIADEEWKEFINKYYSNIRYGIPERHPTALFLKWRKEKELMQHN